MIWCDKGTGAQQRGSAWEIKPKKDDKNGIHAHTFFCQSSREKPGDDVKVYVLSKKDKKIKFEDNS